MPVRVLVPNEKIPPGGFPGKPQKPVRPSPAAPPKENK